MKNVLTATFLTCICITGSAQINHGYPIDPVPFTSVKVTDNFWGQRLQASREVTIPLAFSKCEETGRYENFVKAAHPSDTYKVEGFSFDDTDVYKTIEGASYSLQTYPDKIYYFFWSVDDTGSPNYHVVYGTAQSPLGPIEVAKAPIVLIQNPKEEIYGPAHNSILQVPGKDKWYIVYHRINKNHLNDGPGWHREVCIDRMEFNPDGTIKQVIPTP